MTTNNLTPEMIETLSHTIVLTQQRMVFEEEYAAYHNRLKGREDLTPATLASWRSGDSYTVSSLQRAWVGFRLGLAAVARKRIEIDTAPATQSAVPVGYVGIPENPTDEELRAMLQALLGRPLMNMDRPHFTPFQRDYADIVRAVRGAALAIEPQTLPEQAPAVADPTAAYLPTLDMRLLRFGRIQGDIEDVGAELLLYNFAVEANADHSSKEVILRLAIQRLMQELDACRDEKQVGMEMNADMTVTEVQSIEKAFIAGELEDGA